MRSTPNQKYEITDIAHETYPFLHRIRALQDIGDWAKAGDLGGFVESESNLAVDPEDAAWIFPLCGPPHHEVHPEMLS